MPHVPPTRRRRVVVMQRCATTQGRQLGILSPREVQVLTMVARGQTNGEIAAMLLLSPETVKSHLARVFLKLEVSDRAEAVAVAIQEGML
jgi:DNA-binding NarL/FixJ family response regulator